MLWEIARFGEARFGEALSLTAVDKELNNDMVVVLVVVMTMLMMMIIIMMFMTMMMMMIFIRSCLDTNVTFLLFKPHSINWTAVLLCIGNSHLGDVVRSWSPLLHDLSVTSLAMSLILPVSLSAVSIPSPELSTFNHTVMDVCRDNLPLICQHLIRR